MLRNRGSRFDTGWLVTFSFFFILVEKNLLRNFLSVAKMASLVYERENCGSDLRMHRDRVWLAIYSTPVSLIFTQVSLLFSLVQGGKRPGGETGSPLLVQCVMRRKTGTSAPSALPVQLMAAKNLLSTNRK